MKTDEEKGIYRTNNEPAAVIERPHSAHAIGENGLEEYNQYGWVKMSAKFCAQIKRLRGAKLAIWLCIALNIDENGECKLKVTELCNLTGYSHTEVLNSVEELEKMRFLSVNRGGKKNLYKPIFVAKGKGNSPETLVKKVESTGVDSVESTPQEEKSTSTSIKKEQEVYTDETDFVDLELQKKAKQDGINPALIAFERDMHTPGNWTWYPSRSTQEPEWRALRNFVVKLHAEDPKCFKKYNEWRNRPYVKGAMSNRQIKNYPADFEASWTDYLASSAMYGTSDETSDRPERKIHRAVPEEGVIDFNEAKRRGLIPR